MKSFEFPYRVYTILDHRGEWWKLHTIIYFPEILILLLHAARQKTILQFQESGKSIDHGRNHRLENHFKLGILFTFVDLFDQMIQYRDHELLLFVTREVLELRRFHHEFRQDGRNILLRETIVNVLNFDVFDCANDTLRVDLSCEFLQDGVHYFLYKSRL